MPKNAQFIYGGGGDVTLYDATNGWYHLGYLAELKLTGTPSTAPTNHGQLVQFMMLYKLDIRGLQSNAALISELTDRRTIEQTIYIVGGGKMYTLSGMMLNYGPQLPFNSADPHAVVISAQTAVEPDLAENLLGSYGTFEVDTNSDWIADGWVNSNLSVSSTITGNSNFSAENRSGSYCQEVEFQDGTPGALESSLITVPFMSSIKVTFSAYIYAIDSITDLLLTIKIYDTSDTLIESYSSSAISMSASDETRQSITKIINPTELVKGFKVEISRDASGGAVIQIENAQLEIGGLRDFRDE